MIKQLGSEKGRPLRDGFTFFRTILASKTTEVIKCHMDLEVADLDTT